MAEKWPKNYPKLPIMAQKWPKIAKMAQKWPKMAQNLAQIYLQDLQLFASLGSVDHLLDLGSELLLEEEE